MARDKNDAPRWEWRTFSADLSAIEAEIGLAIQTPPRRSEEIYLLSSASPHSAKIRDGALEVKRLLEVDADGLELWSLAFEAAFPLDAAALARAYEALDLPPPPIPPKSYDLRAFLDEIVAGGEALRPVVVKKARRRFIFFDCAAELVRLRIGDVGQESFALEHRKPARVLAALRELGLDARRNVAYPKGINRVLALSRQA